MYYVYAPEDSFHVNLQCAHKALILFHFNHLLNLPASLRIMEKRPDCCNVGRKTKMLFDTLDLVRKTVCIHVRAHSLTIICP